MNQAEFNALCVAPGCTLRDALLRLEATARGFLMVIGEADRLLRTLTDGDLRRARLSGLEDETPVRDLPAQSPQVVHEDATASMVLECMDRHQIDHIPVLDAQDRPVDVVFRRELSQRIWLSPPHLGEEETAFVEEAFRTNWIAPLGPHVDAFESELAAHVDVGYAAALSSGTAAIHLGLLLLGVQPGDTVFCSSLTFVASCNPILYCNAQPVFIDSEPCTWNMSPQALERAFESARQEKKMPRCVVLVNLYGQSADMDALLPICERYGVPVLEDAAESLGARYKGRASGSFGHLAVYSFNGNKIITTSGGGMLVSNDAALMARAKKLSTQAREGARHYEHVEMGFNYRMSNVLAGIGRGQLRVLDERVRQRRRVFERYQQALSDVTDIRWMPEPEGFHATRWLTCFTLAGEDVNARCNALMRSMERHSIEVRPVWKPMHLQPLFQNAPYFPHANGLDVSRQLFETGVCLPSGSNLSEEQQNRVIAHLRRVLSQPEAHRALV
ncbi:MAG: aminotransferase class I/II-fold pyridoxal phosphate-dependent enzyme [Acidovorax sp.]|uniref:aminotransferase class I/II-fold pyridoxal phosphate-dependent enzyme n=1 Tax=Acidovorax sp. TaxID=1872122 RepID=UPI00391AFAB7